MDNEEFNNELEELIRKINASTAIRVQRLVDKHVKRALKRQEMALRDTYKESKKEKAPAQGRGRGRGRGRGKAQEEKEKEKPKKARKRRYYSSSSEEDSSE